MVGPTSIWVVEEKVERIAFNGISFLFLYLF